MFRSEVPARVNSEYLSIYYRMTNASNGRPCTFSLIFIDNSGSTDTGGKDVFPRFPPSHLTHTPAHAGGGEGGQQAPLVETRWSPIQIPPQHTFTRGA